MKIHTQCRWARFYNIDQRSSTVIDLFNVNRRNIPKSKSEVKILHKYFAEFILAIYAWPRN